MEEEIGEEIVMTEANYQLFEDLCEIIDNPHFATFFDAMIDPDNDKELMKEMIAYLLAKDYTVIFTPEQISGVH